MIRRLNQSCLTRAGMFALMAVLACLLLFQLIPSSHPSEIVVQQEGGEQLYPGISERGRGADRSAFHRDRRGEGQR